MRFTIEEIIELAAETIGACFVMQVFWHFVTSGTSYAMASLVNDMALAVGGG